MKLKNFVRGIWGIVILSQISNAEPKPDKKQMEMTAISIATTTRVCFNETIEAMSTFRMYVIADHIKAKLKKTGFETINWEMTTKGPFTCNSWTEIPDN